MVKLQCAECLVTFDSLEKAIRHFNWNQAEIKLVEINNN